MAAESGKTTSDTCNVVPQWQNATSMVAALDSAQAIIEFDLVGNIVHANDNFLVTLGYTLDEIVGQHHRQFRSHANTAMYSKKSRRPADDVMILLRMTQ